jgi:TRAP-type C4-dicarboxylate transport system substrate-binding protein
MTRIIRAVLGIALAAVALTSAAQEEWKIGTAVGAATVLGSQVTKSADAITKATGGKIKAEHQQVLNEQDLTQQVLRGRLPMMHVTISGAGVAFPDATVLVFPYLWSSAAERDWVYDRYAAPLVNKMYAAKGLTMLRWMDGGINDIFCRFACTDIESLKGKKFRALATPTEPIFMRLLGTNSQQMPLSDFFPALQQGVMDGGHLVFPFYATSPAAQSAPNVLRTRHLNNLFFLVVNTEIWEKQPAEIRKAIMDGLPPTAEFNRDLKEQEEKLTQQFLAKGGKITEMSPAQRQQLIDKISAAHPEMLQVSSAGAKELYAAIQKGKSEFKARK